MTKITSLLVLIFFSLPCFADVLDDTPESFRYFEHTYHISPILFAMFLTAIVETFLLWCFKYRGWKVLTYFFILNLISNLLVNLGAEVLPGLLIEDDAYFYRGRLWQLYYYCIPFLEMFAVVFEVNLLGLMTGYNKKLWLSVFATNLISFLLGVLLFGLQKDF